MGPLNNILAVDFVSPHEVAKKLAARIKTRRLEMNLTQEGLAKRAGVKFSTYRRFEQTGEISLHGFLQIGFALGALSDFNLLFTQKQYQSIEELMRDQEMTRKRGKKND